MAGGFLKAKQVALCLCRVVKKKMTILSFSNLRLKGMKFQSTKTQEQFILVTKIIRIAYIK